MKTDPIEVYILKSEKNLCIATAVSRAWQHTRDKLVSGFLARLDARLKRRLKGWKSELAGGQFFVDAYPGYYIWKDGWKRHSIGIHCGKYGDRMQVGVARDTGDTRRVPLSPQLLIAVQKYLPSAKSDAWWEAQVIVHSPEPDWRKPEALWRMHKDPSFLEDVAEQLLRIAAVCAPIIDRLPRKLR